jgi:hypothetical protein
MERRQKRVYIGLFDWGHLCNKKAILIDYKSKRVSLQISNWSLLVVRCSVCIHSLAISVTPHTRVPRPASRLIFKVLFPTSRMHDGQFKICMKHDFQPSRSETSSSFASTWPNCEHAEYLCVTSVFILPDRLILTHVPPARRSGVTYTKLAHYAWFVARAVRGVRLSRPNIEPH